MTGICGQQRDRTCTINRRRCFYEYAPVECVNTPKMLFQEKQYEKLSVDAKLLYSLLLDRKTLANMNGWIDQNGTAYVVYPKSEMKKHLNASRYRVDRRQEAIRHLLV